MLNGNLKNDQFFAEMKDLILINLEENKYDEKDLIRLLDIYKFSEEFRDQEMKQILCQRLNDIQDNLVNSNRGNQ